jgi:hypothetical protein
VLFAKLKIEREHLLAAWQIKLKAMFFKWTSTFYEHTAGKKAITLPVA